MSTVLITGVSKGIGKELARIFEESGYVVLGTERDPVSEEQKESLKLFTLDLSDPKSIESFADSISNTGVKIDILINNAGTLVDDELTQVHIDKLRQTLEVNLIGTIDLTERMLPIMNNNGHIINISSTAGSLTHTTEGTDSHYPNHYPAYKISKCALNMYTRTLAMRFRLEKSDIRVSSVHPGWVKTDIGGEEADIEPKESARHIYEFAITRPESGKFWFEGKELEW
ncbi:MAG: SDR family NAD(P)-dependent oxidoreductase [Candidatus Paceibacterota bacterium]|jgi:NAD(P)-dependent dehydrogenase (short-subunit alcohol dehydrogenase family)